MLRGRIGGSDDEDMEPIPNHSTSPAASDSISQRLIRYGIPDEFIHSKENGLSRYVKEHPDELRLLATAILPSPSDVQALVPHVSDEALVTSARQSIQDQCQEAVNWLLWCAFGTDPKVGLEEVKQRLGGVRGVCGVVWGMNDIAYRCHTCEHDPTCAICVACFQAGDHSSHDYSMIRTNGGCCDCGDSTAWKEAGFCSRHRGPGQAPPLPVALVEILRPVLEVLLGEWRNRLNSALRSSPRSKKWLLMSPDEKVAGPLSLIVVNMLLDFCNCSESMLSFTAEHVSNEELLDTLFSAEHILAKNVNTKLHELLYKLLGDPDFKYRFAQTFIRRYPKFLRDSLFEDAGGQGITFRQREQSILGSFSVQIFTVPTLTPRLVIEWKLLEMLFGILTDFFLSCVGEDGRFVVSRPAVQERVYVRAVEDVRYVMSHLKVAQYIIHEFPQLCRTWLQFLGFIQGMYPQKRITNIHIEEENEDWVSAFLLEAQMANIHPLFVLGTSLVKDGWDKFSSLGINTGQAPGDEDKKEAGTGTGAYSVIEGVVLSKALIWMISECVGVLDAWFAADRAKEASKLAKTSKENSQVPSQKRRSHFRGRIAPSFGRDRNQGGPVREWFHQLVDEVVDDVFDEASEMDVDTPTTNDWWLGSEAASGTALSLIGGKEWPKFEFDVGKQEVSFHIPLHRMLSLLLHKALEEYEAKTSGATSSSDQSNFMLRLFPEAFQVPGLAALLMEHPLRLQVLCAQVQAGMWRRNGHTVSALCDLYRSVQWCEDGLELDLFMLQCSAAMASPEDFVEKVVSCFGLADYFSLFLWKPNEYEPVLAHELLVFLIRAISERGLCGLSSKESLRRELVQRLAIGDAAHSSLMNALPPRLRDNPHIHEVLEACAHFRRPHGMQQGKYLLREQSWRELDLYHPRWTPKELQSAEERYLRVCKSSAIFSQAPVWRNPFLPLQGLSRLAVSAKVHELLRALFFHGAFSPNLSESRSPESLLFTALHLLHLGLDICAKVPPAKDRYPLLALSTEEVRVSGPDGAPYPAEQSTISLLVLLMRKYNASEGAQIIISETTQYNVGSFIKGLLHKYAELDRQCMYAIEKLAPEILHRLSAGPSKEEASSSNDDMQAEISDYERKRALARERQALMMAKMRAAQDKFLASVETTENDPRRAKQDTSRIDGKRPREDTDTDETVCALCRDRTSGSPLCVLTLVQRSRLLALSQKPVPSWDKVSEDVEEASLLEEDSGAVQNMMRREAENLISELRQWLEGAVADPNNNERLTNRDDFFEMLREELPAMFNTERLAASVSGMETSPSEGDTAIDEAENVHDASTSFIYDPSWWEAGRLAVREGGENHGIISVLAEYVALVTQTLHESRQPAPDTEAPRDNTRMRRLRHTIESKVYNSIGINDSIGLNISACGHAAHHECVERYYSSLLQRYYSRSLFEGVQIVDPDLGEFLCPVCRRLSNSVFPVLESIPPSLGASDAGVSFKLEQACSLLYKAEEALSKSEFRESLQRRVSDSLKPVLDSLSKRLFGLFYPEKDTGSNDGLNYQSLFLWDLLRYSIMSAELASRTKSLILGVQDAASKLVTLEESADASRGSTLPMLLHTASLTSTHSRQTLLLRARGMQLMVGSICHGVSRDFISDKSSKSHLHLHGLLHYLEKGQDSADGQFWKRTADPILVHDPFSSLIWALFALPLQVQQYQSHFTAFVHLFYLVSVIQCLASTTRVVDASLPPQVRAFLLSLHAGLAGNNVLGASEEPMNLDDIRRLTLPYLRRCALLQTIFSSLPAPISGSNSWELTNVYSLVSGQAYQEAVSRGVEADVFELKDVEELEKRFCLPSLERILAEETTQSLALKWCKHLQEGEPRRASTLPRAVRARPFQLLRLPRLFQDLLQHFIKKRCKKCDSVPERPALCLLCGTLCCGSGPNGCCSVHQQSECYRHAVCCGGGVGVFLMLRRTNVLLLRRERQAIWPSPYLDAFGEEDQDMKRGKPLYLSEERYAALTAMVASHSLDYSTSALSNATRDMF